MPERLTLRQKQSLFARCLGELLQYATHRSYELTLGEAHVDTPRKTRAGRTVDDGVHMTNSLHYSRLAVDVNLFIDGKYISDGQHEAWTELGTLWEQLHHLCRWGGRFNDANHFSVTHGGRS